MEAAGCWVRGRGHRCVARQCASAQGLTMGHTLCLGPAARRPIPLGKGWVSWATCSSGRGARQVRLKPWPGRSHEVT